MTLAQVRRIRSMSRAELAFRSRAAIRTRAQRATIAVRGSSWNRQDILDVLAEDVVDADLRRHVADRRWEAVERRLRDRLRGRRARFVLDGAAAPSLRAAITRRWPEAPARAAAAGDALVAARFSLLGFEALSFARDGAAIDWHFDPVHGRVAPTTFWANVPYLDPACGDHKIIWELNRHQHFLALGRALWLTGERRYGDAIVSQLEDWLARNPPLVGINWASMLEIGLRSIAWIWALHILLADGETTAAGPGGGHDTPWLLDMLVALDRQLTHVEQNLSHYFSPNTHLTGEALALYVAGVALPELQRSGRWTHTGRQVLLRELQCQICPDGGHVERSTHYHRYTLDFYLLALLTARQADESATACAFRGAVTQLAAVMRAMAGEGGRIPLIGDDDGGHLWPITSRDPADVRDSLALADLLLDAPGIAPAVPEEAFWIAWTTCPDVFNRPDAGGWIAPPRADVETHAFPDTGFVTMRSGRDHLVLDCGPHGFLNGGHAHADALSITLELGGRPFLIDPGTGSYTAEPQWRDRFRRSQSHNTLTLDGRSSATPGGPFRWQSRADAHLDAWADNPGFGWAEAWHDGYLPAHHRRSVVCGPGHGWLIVDEVTGHGDHVAQTHWHFDPAWQVTVDGPGRLRATTPDGDLAWLLFEGDTMQLAHGDTASGLGWCSPRYGRLTPTWSAQLTQSLTSPATRLSWMGSGATAPRLDRLPVSADPAMPAVAVQIRHELGTVVTLLRPGDEPDRLGRSLDGGGYHTNARLLQYAMDRLGWVRLSLADGSQALALHDPLLSVRAHERVHALHVAVRGDDVRLRTSRPPERLELRGPGLRSVRRAWLNGREQRCAPGAAGLVFIGADWGPPDPDARTPARDGVRLTANAGDPASEPHPAQVGLRGPWPAPAAGGR